MFDYNFLNSFTPFLELIVLTITGILSYVVGKNTNKYISSKERLTNFYCPIFQFIEHKLYKKIDDPFAREFIYFFNTLKASNYIYIYPALRHRVTILEKCVNNSSSSDELNKEWNLICNYIENDFDKLCKETHMPLRSTSYRLNNRQYSTKGKMYFNLFKLLFISVAPLIAIMFIALYLTNYLY